MRLPFEGMDRANLLPNEATVRMAYYDGGGTGSGSGNTSGAFYSTLNESAAMAFGADGFHINIVAEPQIQKLERDEYDIVVFPGGRQAVGCFGRTGFGGHFGCYLSAILSGLPMWLF